MSLTKEALLNAYNVSVAENGETNALTAKIRFALMQHFTDLRDLVNQSPSQAPVTVDNREPVDFSAFYKKKVSGDQVKPIAVELSEADIKPDGDSKIEAEFSPDNLKAMSEKTPDDLLKDTGIEKLRAAATALGFKISHTMPHLKFTEKFIEALKIALTA